MPEIFLLFVTDVVLFLIYIPYWVCFSFRNMADIYNFYFFNHWDVYFIFKKHALRWTVVLLFIYIVTSYFHGGVGGMLDLVIVA